MNVLILGSGGREHALGWKIKQSPLLQHLYIAPGNAGTSNVGQNLDIQVDEFDAIRSAIIEKEISLVIVGPEDPLVNGFTDFIKADPKLKQVKIVGPGKEGAKLEGSKDFAKKFMKDYDIPTARYATFSKGNYANAVAFLQTLKPPYVLKADGLAAGKGVLILDQLDDAKQELQSMLDGKFGKAGNKVVIEEFLSGIELSVFALTDGKDYILLPEAKDYKRIGEADAGLNTGGMGAVSPVSFADEVFMDKVIKRIVEPTIRGIGLEAFDYKGFIFFGLINVGGDPFVIEYNVRLGDPETEVVIPRIESDLLLLLLACVSGRLKGATVTFDPRAAATVMLVSGGYPEVYEKGKSITGLSADGRSQIFHAGTKQQDGVVVTNGGRVLSITSFGSNFKEALTASYRCAEGIHFEKKYYRKDIGFDL